MKDLNAESLHKKYQSGTCTPEEEILVEQHLKNSSIYENLSEDELELEIDELDERLYTIFPEEKNKLASPDCKDGSHSVAHSHSRHLFHKKRQPIAQRLRQRRKSGNK